MPLDRLIARYDFADFYRAAADATLGAAIKPLVLSPAISPTRSGGGSHP